MKEQTEQRLNQLRTEFESGQKMLADLEAKQANLKTTLLRISGAIQVLEELLAEPNNPAELNSQPREKNEAFTQPNLSSLS